LYVARRVADAQGGSASGSLDDGLLTFRLELPVPGPEEATP
jgi:hypothetical protein